MSAAALRQALARGQLTATGLTQAFLDRIEAVNPVLGAVIAVSPDALEQAAASERAWEAGQPRAAGGNSRPGQGQRAGRGPADHGGLVGAARRAPAGRVHRLPAAGGGRRHPGQGEPVRVGQLPLHPLDQRLVHRRGPDGEPLRARPQPVRVQLRVRRRAFRRPGAAGSRHRDRRLDRLSRQHLRRGRGQADHGAGQPVRDRAAVPGPGHRGPDGDLGRGRGGAAFRARRGRPRGQRGRPSGTGGLRRVP